MEPAFSNRRANRQDDLRSRGDALSFPGRYTALLNRAVSARV